MKSPVLSLLKTLSFIVALACVSVGAVADENQVLDLGAAAQQLDPAAVAAAGSGQWPGIPAVKYTPNSDGSGEYTVTIQILALMTVMSVLPSLLIMMTSFTRIIVVFAILRQALGLQATPSNQILLGLALFLSIFIMKPVLEEANRVGLQPYLQEQVTSLEAVELASRPFKAFMLAQTREDDLALFMRIADVQYDTPQDVSFWVLMPAFVTSELKTAFQIGFILFIPFLIIDMVVASVLMAMGMMMLSPMLVSLPFKLLLFVLVDGWVLLLGTLASSFVVSGGAAG